MFHLSQGQLNLLEGCPRKFQHIYLEQLGSPPPLEHQERLSWGNRFHLLMQQQELGLPIHYFASADEQLQRSIEALIQAAPDLFQVQPMTFRQSEHRRTLEFQGYLFTVIYDLLILDDQQAQIHDWKTYPLPQNSYGLKQNWQTRLYPFVLAETSRYKPEQISMTYWFVQAQEGKPNPQHLKFGYSEKLHQQTRQKLTYLLSQLTEWLEHYERGEFFPQIEEPSPLCGTCTFAVRCQREQVSPGIDQGFTTDWFDISEIEELAL